MAFYVLLHTLRNKQTNKQISLSIPVSTHIQLSFMCCWFTCPFF